MNFPHSSKSSGLARLLRLLKPALLEKKFELAQALGALALLSLSQSFFLILVGPLFKAAFEDTGRSSTIVLGSLFPQQIVDLLPGLRSLQIARSDLALYLPLSLLLVAAVKSIAGYLFQYKQTYLALHLGMRYRQKVFSAILSQSFGQLQAKSPATWMSIVMHDIQFLQSRLSDLFAGLIRDGSVIVSSLLALYFIHWPTAVFVTLLSVPITLSAGRTGRKISRYAEKWQAELARISAAILDIRRRFEFIRSQKGEGLEFQVFQKLNLHYYEMVKKSIWIRSAFAPGLEFLGFCFFALVIYLIAQGRLGQDFGTGDLLQFLAAIGILLKPLKSIGEQLSRYHETMGILKTSLASFDEAQASLNDPVSQLSPASRNQEPFVLEAIELQYGQGFALKAKELRVSPGQAVALIGPSGAGKSTLLKSLGGLLHATDWRGPQSWSEVVAESNFVSQHPFLFSGTLRENLSYGFSVPPTDQAMEEALDFVEIRREMENKGMTLDSSLNFLLSPLSGGQLQRLTIARALLRPQSLLLFDEVTSAIDPMAEEILIHKLIQHIKEKSLRLIFVTHRLNHIQLFDQLWFCEAGEVRSYSRSEWPEQARIQSFVRTSLTEG